MTQRREGNIILGRVLEKTFGIGKLWAETWMMWKKYKQQKKIGLRNIITVQAEKTPRAKAEVRTLLLVSRNLNLDGE